MFKHLKYSLLTFQMLKQINNNSPTHLARIGEALFKETGELGEAISL